MKAAIITSAREKPAYGDFNEPVCSEQAEIITVSTSALSQFSKSRSSGAHYSADQEFPSVAGPTALAAQRMAGGSISCCRKPRMGRSPRHLWFAPSNAFQFRTASVTSRRPRSPIRECRPGLPCRNALTFNQEKRYSSMARRERRAGSRSSLRNILEQEELSGRDGMKVNSRNWSPWARTS